MNQMLEKIVRQSKRSNSSVCTFSCHFKAYICAHSAYSW